MAYESHRFCKDGMEYFSSRPGRVFAIRLDRGDLILESIIEFVKKEGIKDAVVVSGIGTLDCCTLHMVMTTGIPVVEHFKKWEDKPLNCHRCQASYGRRALCMRLFPTTWKHGAAT